MKTKDKEIDNSLSPMKIILAFLVIVGLILAAITSINEKGLDLPQLLIIIFSIFLAINFIWRIISELKTNDAGFPLVNNRLNKVRLIAAAKSFEVSIWWLLILIWSVSVFKVIKLDVDQVLGVGIVGMLIIFGISWLSTNIKEDLRANEKISQTN